jgi:ParB-like chromosome segregation protein Spo0J
LKDHADCRFELVPVRSIKRIPGFRTNIQPKHVKKIEDFIRERGYCMPVILAESEGGMTLLSGIATFEACLEGKMANVPAVIVQTDGDADNLIFALQSEALNEPANFMGISIAIVQLVDVHGVSRKHIAKLLGKSPAWINRMEKLSRKMNETVQALVAQEHVCLRSAQEIARLPDAVQTPFAIAVGNEFLSKDSVTYLVNRYLNEDISEEERDRIIRTPRLALPDEKKGRTRNGRDCSDSARLSAAISRCLDDAACLSRLLARIDMDAVAVHMRDVDALAESLDSLARQVQAIFSLGE